MKRKQLNAVIGIVTSLIFSTTLFAQKKTIDHTSYNQWKRFSEQLISPSGDYFIYGVKPLKGDGYVYIKNLKSGKLDSIPRAENAKLSTDESFLVVKITPGYDTLRKVELKKIPKDKWPKDSLGIYYLKRDSLVKVPKLKEFKLAEKSNLLTVLSTSNDWPSDYLSKKEKKKEDKQNKKKAPIKTDGKLATIYTWNAEKQVLERTKCFKNVQQIEPHKNGKYAVFIEQEKLKKDSLRFGVYQLENQSVYKDAKRFVEWSGINVERDTILALASNDTTEQKKWNLYTFALKEPQLNLYFDTTERFTSNLAVSSNYKMKWINGEQSFFIGVSEAPKKPVKDTLLETEKVKLDLWSWSDDRLQPQQLVELKRDQTKTELVRIDFAQKSKLKLGSDTLYLRWSHPLNYNFALASSDESYNHKNWEAPLPADYYRLNGKTGQLELLRKKTYFDAQLSPSGNWFYYYDELKKEQFIKNLSTNVTHCLTCGVKANFFEDINGMPLMAGPSGILGWTKNENELLIQAEKGIYSYDLNQLQLKNITNSLQSNATDTNYTYSLYTLFRDSAYITPSVVTLVQINERDKSEKLFELNGSIQNPVWELIEASNHHFGNFIKSENKSTLLYSKQSVIDFPDMYKEGKKLTTLNPQQANYNWASVELINWTTPKGLKLDGLLYKPENYDPSKKYPMIVYYYELNSNQFHAHHPPRPTASIVHPTEYASAGYFILIPDIRYTAGSPADGAYDCILSATDAALKKYPSIDSKRLGLQGQSWGGYQTAQLITMTDKYAAAMAGAPVGNMTSAYGGIRWGSGLSRQFQYEHTQSRIGKNLWDGLDLYLKNSPVFQLPKVKTPLLIMHNDADGAVPWYQGIELFTGLRRLDKPVWMLNYNGDDHNLTKLPNKIDLSIRMRQFFDFYLLNAPQPKWMNEGIPAIKKGKELNYDLMK